MSEEKPEKITIYLNKNNREIVLAGRKKGIKPSKALVKGFELLMGNAATYNVLEKKRDDLLNKVAKLENQMDELKDNLQSTPEVWDETIKDLQKAYYRNGELSQQVLENRRVKLGLNNSEMATVYKEQVKAPIDSGEVDPLRDF